MIGLNSVFAQESRFSIGVQTKYSWSKLSFDNVRNQKGVTDLSPYVYLEYRLSENLSLKQGWGLIKKGVTGNIYIDNIHNTINTHAIITHSLNYWEAPLVITYTSNGKIKFYCEGGFMLSYLLNSKLIFSPESNLSPGESWDSTSGFKKLDFGLSLGVGLLVPVSNSTYIDISIRDDYGLLSVKGGNSVKTNSLAVHLGVKFDL